MGRQWRVLFLDFDGVLNHTDYLREAHAKHMLGTSGGINPTAVALVNDLLTRAGDAAVVISSSWRIGRKRTELCDILNARGFEGIVLGMTPILGEYRTPDGFEFVRGHEIQKWLDVTRFDVSSFVILDDDSDMAHLIPRLVKTSFTTGLTPEHVEQALQILKEPYVRVKPGSV